MKDIKYLLKFKNQFTDCLSEKFQLTKKQAIEIVEILEKEDLLRFEAPKYGDQPVSTIIEDRKLAKNNLSMTSHKKGNIIVNTFLDWRKIAGVVLSSIETIMGTSHSNSFMITVGILSCLLSLSSLKEIKINENGTAIIMALQQHSKHQSFAASKQSCMKEANEILLSHRYHEMDFETFENELSVLYGIKCINIIDDKIKLIEKVILHY